MKFIFRGQVIEDVSTTLQQLGVTNNSAIHVQISQPRPQAAEQEPANQTDENEILDLSNLFVPLFGVILGIVWVSFFMWPNVFSLLTKLSLFALSLGYVVLTYATFTCVTLCQLHCQQMIYYYGNTTTTCGGDL